MALFSLIRELQPGKIDWAIRVRVVRMYKSPVWGKPEEIASIELILHDKEGQRIHASIKIDHWKKMKVDIQEGQLYAMKNFVVTENKSTYKTTTNKFKLFSIASTRVFEFQDQKFPTLMYNLQNFEDFTADREVDENQLIDVIGRVISFQPPAIMNGVASRRLDFRIADLKNNQITCCVWEEHKDKLLPILEGGMEGPVIISLKFARAKRMRGETKISSTYHVTKLSVNEDDDVFLTFRDRLTNKGEGSINKVMSLTYYEIYDVFAQGNAKVRSLAYLCRMQEDNEYWIDATIVDIETTTDYWYLACQNCARKIVPDEDTIKCPHCNSVNSEHNYRYKIEVRVIDNSGSAKLLLWNKACMELIGKSASELKMQKDEKNVDISAFITEALIEKNGLFEVQVTSNKKNKNSDYYTVSRATTENDIKELYRQKTCDSQESIVQDTGAVSEFSSEGEDLCANDLKQKSKEKVEFFGEDKEISTEKDAVTQEEIITTDAKFKDNAATQSDNQDKNASDVEGSLHKTVNNDVQSETVYSSKRKKIRVKQEK